MGSRIATILGFDLLGVMGNHFPPMGNYLMAIYGCSPLFLPL